MGNVNNNFTQKKHFNSSGNSNQWIKDMNRDWMRYVSGERELRTISIPGTHNSAAELFNNVTYHGSYAACQSKCITHQLENGIRFFDIRCCKHSIFHGPTYMNKSLREVLRDFSHFLTHHPSETVIMRLKLNEHCNNEENGTLRERVEIFQSYCREFPDLFFQSNGILINNLRLSQIRGKIVVLQNEDLGASYSWNDCNVEDESDAHDREKRESILRGLNNCILHPDRVNITFVSSSFSFRPLHLFIQASAEPNNNHTYYLLGKFDHVGIVVFDYPGDEIICHVINKNVYGYDYRRLPRDFDVVNVHRHTSIVIQSHQGYLCFWDSGLIRYSGRPDADCVFQMISCDLQTGRSGFVLQARNGQYVSLGSEGIALRNHRRGDEVLTLITDRNGMHGIRNLLHQGRYLSIGSEGICVRGHHRKDEEVAIYSSINR